MDARLPKYQEGWPTNEPNKPCWFPVRDQSGNKIKPIIRCNCGTLVGIGLHHVWPDGRVTASFFHARVGEHPQGHPSGCGWHVMVLLEGWDGGDYPPTAQ